MKKAMALILSACMLITLAACGGTSTPAASSTPQASSTASAAPAPAATPEPASNDSNSNVKAPEDTLVCLAISTLGNDFMVGVNGAMKDKFTADGYKFESANADGDAQRQINQIENFITMGADVIVVMAVEATGLTDVCRRAMDAGVCVYAFTTNTKSYTIFRGASETLLGESIAQMASEWVDKTFPDAAAGSVNAIVLKYMESESTVERSDALSSITNFNSKVNILTATEVGYTAAEAMATCENLALTYDNVQLVLTYNGGIGSGVNAYAFSPNSAWKNYETLGVFGSDSTEEINDLIRASATNESVYRGSSLVGRKALDETINDIYTDITGWLSGTADFQKDHYADPVKITVENVD